MFRNDGGMFTDIGAGLPGIGFGPPGVPGAAAWGDYDNDGDLDVLLAGRGVSFFLGAPARIELAVFDLAGRRVRTLVAGERPAGTHEVWWEGGDEHGRPVATGVHFLRFSAGDRAVTRPVLRLE